jgi:hypothetical protein
MKAYSKEFYEAQAMFERENKYLRLDKPTQEMRERIPVGEWYNSGETNKLFRSFLSGVEYGEKIAAWK